MMLRWARWGELMHKPEYSSRLSTITPFKVMEVLRRAKELEAQGHHVIHMEVGEPDFPTPPPIVSAGQRGLASGYTKYTDARGLPQLRTAVAEYYKSDYGLDLSEDRVFITAGGSGALLLATALVLDPGDNLVMSDPGYPCNRHFLSVLSATARLVPLGAEAGYQLSGKLVDEFWTQRTRGVLIASPSNPTGALMTDRALKAVADVIQSRQGHLISDEIYHGLVYTQVATKSALHVDNNAFVVNSFSKYFGMTGWRLGWLIVPEAAIQSVEKLAQNLFICASSVAQYAAIAAFTPESRRIMEAQREEFQFRRDFLFPALREVGFDVARQPEGAFYVYAGIPEGFPDSEQFCKWLLEEHHVAVTPGTDFGFHRATRHVRFSYAQTMDRLALGVERLSSAMGHR